MTGREPRATAHPHARGAPRDLCTVSMCELEAKCSREARRQLDGRYGVEAELTKDCLAELE